MKLILSLLLAAGAVLSLSAAEDPFKTPKEKISYMLGMTYGKQIKQNDIEVDFDQFLKGLKDAATGGQTLLTEDQAREIYMTFTQELRTKSQDKQKAEGEKNRKAGEVFLAENKKKEGVKVKPITVGTNTYELQYKVVTEGKGKMPATSDTVSTHYRGTLIDGTEFDNSYKRGEPAKFPVTGVIKGWTEALLMMPVGSKWQLFIPSELAYGERGRPSIPGNSTLLFDIELIGIEAAGQKN
jgi:FKBP-type peptidyl-prolyl cis-trans isomerase FklB